MAGALDITLERALIKKMLCYFVPQRNRGPIFSFHDETFIMRKRRVCDPSPGYSHTIVRRKTRFPAPFPPFCEKKYAAGKMRSPTNSPSQ